MTRFTGTVEYLADVDVQPLVDWVTAIDFEDWPQQTPVDSQLRPAMVKDLAWHGFGERISALLDALTFEHFQIAKVSQPMLTVVMPGHDIPPHTDEQPSYWQCRVHLPLTTNDESRFIVGDEHHYMEVGKAYRVNTEVLHSVENSGATPRIHLMFDVVS